MTGLLLLHHSVGHGLCGYDLKSLVQACAAHVRALMQDQEHPD
ncbi:hypothetical protein GALL_201010 [mine drainage metagenome]|uniref:Uncharacterized protein n=1 Tax=mine drainage metagenome TaxID=410659 RepID=A0A1J5S192_9ZZZZ